MTGASLPSTAAVGLVGRERELAELKVGLDGAARGHGQVWLLDGEPGIGKTRLLEAVTEAAQPTEIRVLWGRCWESGGAPAYWPWAQILRMAVADVELDALSGRLGAGASDVACLAPDLILRLPGLSPAPVPETLDARFRLFDAVGAFFVRTAAETPLLVALDDLHAADEASLLLLEFVAAQAASSNLVIVGTYRSAEVAASARLTQLLSAVARHGQRLTLTGLRHAEVEILLEAATNGPVAPELVVRVHEATEGNPFLIKEVSRLLGARRGRPRPGDRLPLPDEAHAIVGRRLAGVPNHLRGVLAAAAVLGRDFDMGPLAALAGEAPAQLLDALGEGRRQGVVEEMGAGRWTFAHALLREVLYDEITPSTRAELHRHAADALERRPEDDAGAHLAAIAHHRYEAARAGVDARATDACAAAGAQAMTTLAFEDAAGWYERALEVLVLSDDPDERRRYDLLAALGGARFRSSQFDEARIAYRGALERARSIGCSELLAEAALGFFGLFRRLERDAVTVLDEALADLPETDSTLRARLMLSLGGGLLVTRPDEWQRAAAMCDDGLAMARRAGDAEALLTVLLHWHRCQWEWNPVAVEQRLAVADEGLRLSQEAGRAGEWARYMLGLWRFCDLLDLGRVEAARLEADDASREAQRLRLPYLSSVAEFMHAALALLEGDLDRAHDLAQRGYVPLEEFDDRLGWFTTAIRRQKGELHEARDALEGVRPPPSTSFGPYWHLSFRADAALSAAELGKPSARRELDAVASDALTLPGPPLDPDVLVRLTQACWLLGAADLAEPLYERLGPYRARLITYQVVAAPLGAADRHLGQLAALLGRHDAAAEHFEAAHALHRRWGAFGFLAHGQADHARMLLARGRPADAAQAAEMASAAAAAYRALGMAFYEERAAELVSISQSRRRPLEAPPPVPQRHVLREEGEYWCFGYDGREVRLRDSKGLRHLVRLLRAPGREFHVLDLTHGGSLQERCTVGGDAGAVLDPAAKAAYRRRLVELEAEADEADAAGDPARAERVQAERDFLVAELAAAVGLGGRDRVSASAAERARQSVSKSLRGAVARVGQVHASLGRHLEATVRTGVYCAYQPDPRVPIIWETS